MLPEPGASLNRKRTNQQAKPTADACRIGISEMRNTHQCLPHCRWMPKLLASLTVSALLTGAGRVLVSWRANPVTLSKLAPA